LAAVGLTEHASPEQFRRHDLMQAIPRSYLLTGISSTDTLDTGLVGILDWAIRTDSGGTVSASLDSTTGIFTFTSSADAVGELFVWAHDTV